MTTSRKTPEAQNATTPPVPSQAAGETGAPSQTPPDFSTSSAAPSGLRKWTFMIDEEGSQAAAHERETNVNKENDGEPLDTMTFDALLACLGDEDLLDGDGASETAAPMTPEQEQTQAQRIRVLNDTFRQSLAGGAVHITAGILELGARAQAAILQQVRTFTGFDQGNDPFGEHDFGAFEFGEDTIFWKIDYYDPSLIYGSDDPADPAKTTRVITIMLASEY
jgi:hypothetical protein